jgi:hypothetical protein
MYTCLFRGRCLATSLHATVFESPVPVSNKTQNLRYEYRVIVHKEINVEYCENHAE